MSYKRLDRRMFRLPEPVDAGATSVVVDERALDDLLDGIDVEQVERKGPRVRMH